MLFVFSESQAADTYLGTKWEMENHLFYMKK